MIMRTKPSFRQLNCELKKFYRDVNRLFILLQAVRWSDANKDSFSQTIIYVLYQIVFYILFDV